MDQSAPTVNLLVDGNILKRHITHMGQRQNAQLIVQYLSHMTRLIRQHNPGAFVRIEYYGAQSLDPITLPISGNTYCETDLKKGLFRNSVPGAWLNSNWGKMIYPADAPWILKADRYHKDNLQDNDFVLNERPKGVLAQLVWKMAELSVRSPETPLYVYGDADDMAYSLHMSRWLGANIHQMNLDGNKPYISEIIEAKEPRFCDKKQILKMGQDLNEQADAASYLKALREACPEGEKKIILMVDVGVLRKYLDVRDCRPTAENIQALLDQIKQGLPKAPTKTVLYHSFAAQSKLISPFPGEARALVDASFDKQILSLPNVEVSAGKTTQDKWYPAILKKEKWNSPAKERGYRDFSYNFHQNDTDDRMIWNMHDFAMNRYVVELCAFITDGDLVHAVEQAAAFGLPTTLVRFQLGTRDLSRRLKHSAQEVIEVPLDETKLVTREMEEKLKRERQDAETSIKRKQLQRLMRDCARNEQGLSDSAHDFDEAYDEDDDMGMYGWKASKEERWAECCRQHRSVRHNHKRHRSKKKVSASLQQKLKQR